MKMLIRNAFSLLMALILFAPLRGNENVLSEKFIANLADAIVAPNGRIIYVFRSVILFDDSWNFKFHDGTNLYALLNDDNFMKPALGSAVIIHPEIVFCGEMENIALIRVGPLTIRPKQVDRLPIKEGEVWLAVIKPMFDEAGNIKKITQLDDEKYKNFLNFPCINAKTFFYVPLPANTHALKLGSTAKMDISIQDALEASSLDFIADLKLLSALFCNKKTEIIKSIESLNAISDKLKSELGQRLASKIIEKLEKTYIAQEFPETTPEGQAALLKAKREEALKQLHKQHNNADYQPPAPAPAPTP